MDFPPYNPASDGLYAKVWECLRRNSTFLHDVEAERIFCKRRKGSHSMLIASYLRGHNHLVSSIGDMLVEGGFGFKRGQATRLRGTARRIAEIGYFSPFSERDAWPKLPSALHWFFSSMEKLNGALPFLLDRPHLYDAMRKKSEKRWKRFDLNLPRISGEEMWTAIRDEQSYSDYDVICVPRTIRDKGHRTAVLDALEKMVAATSKDVRLFKPSGKILGTKAEWDAFLIFEYYQTQGRTTKVARHMAAWFCFDREDFRAWPANERFSEGCREQARSLYARLGTHIDNRIVKIQKAIESVYPVFQPFA